MNSTSISLLQRIRADDELAWSQFVDIYSPLVYYWCQRGRLNEDDAADVMQEVFKSVASSVETFRREKSGQFRSWLRVITDNKLRDFYRRVRIRPKSAGGSTMHRRLAEIPDSADEDADNTERAIITRRALELMQKDFEETSWRAFWMASVEGKTATEIAEDLAITKNAVWQACYRIRKRLREELEGLLD